jgi:TolB protein
MRKLTLLSITIILLLSLAACAGGMPLPTSTPVPLAATATPRPRATRPPTQTPPPLATPAATDSASAEPMATPAPLPDTPIAEEAAPEATTSDLLSELDRRLARQTVKDFLQRLAAGQATSALDLYLTDQARAGEAGQVLLSLGAPGAQPAEAILYEFVWVNDALYEARAELRWREGENRGEATQTITLALIKDRGVWRIDDIDLGPLRSPSPTPAPTARGKTGGRPAPSLPGKLAFQVSSGGDIYRINADGSGLRRLTDGLDPAWSPGGERLAFIRWRYPWGIYLLDASGAETRVVDGDRLKEVAWSPDGKQLAFSINTGSSEPRTICFFGFCFTLPPFSLGQIWLADLDGGGLLSLPLDDKAVHAPAWSPDGGRIVYAGDRGLAWIELDGMETGRFASSSPWDTSPAFSPDGAQIAFMGRVHDHWEIFTMNADGSGRKQLTWGATNGGTPTHSVAPAWSPDGKYLAFLSDRDGPWRIYIMRPGVNQQRLLFGARLDGLGLRYEWASERVISWSE